MEPVSSPVRFYRRITGALADENLQRALAATRDKFTSHRASAIDKYCAQGGDFEQLREWGKQRREEAVCRMPELLREFEHNARAAGATVLWAKDAAAARRLITEIVHRHDAKLAVKSKSMASEEISLNNALLAAGVEAVETDLGEFIVQQSGETPSHIIAPAMHKSRQQAAEIIKKTSACDGDDIPALTRAARAHLREKFLRADVGISGANFLIAETGSSLIVTNEGNGRMSMTLPPVHITIAGIDKIIPKWEDIPGLLKLLTVSATGQRLSNYVSILTGGGTSATPAHTYIVLLDNGRAALRHGDCREMLRCIRCGACMNHCPVYHAIGGHAYDATYMGPMGQVLAPSLNKTDSELPHAATMCGACAVVCPVKIPLPDLMRRLRRRHVEKRPMKERMFLRLWFFVARRPRLYAMTTSAAAAVLAFIGGQGKIIHRLPFMRGWFAERDLSAPCGHTFRAMQKRARQ